MRRIKRIIVTIFSLCLIYQWNTTLGFAMDSFLSAVGPLRVLPSNPRYFTDGSGKAVYLTGSATHANFKDWGYSDPPSRFDYTEYLNFLQQHNHNFIRLWTFEQTQWLRFSDSLQQDATVFVGPFPWLRTGPGT